MLKQIVTITLIALLSAVWANTALADAVEDPPLSAAVECSPRGGLPHFFAKLRNAGNTVRVAYFGGSITAQPGYRVKSLEYFRKTYPAVKFGEINAAIGGTGSDLGVFRYRQDVLEKKPDLVFVEFAVNDGGAPAESIYRCMEGIVRQTYRTLPDCDVCFVYTLVGDWAPQLAGGHFPHAASAMEKISDQYGIPSIHMGLEVAKLAAADKLILKGELPKTDEQKKTVGDRIVFSPDNVHPYPETGHELYLQAIVRSLPGIEMASKETGPKVLPAPFDAANYENAKMLPIDPAMFTPGFEKLDPATSQIAKNFADRLPVIYRGHQPGQTLKFKFKGTYAAIFDVIGPDCGQISFVTDDGQPGVQPRFDPWCTYHRLAMTTVARDLPDAVHTVTITITPEKLDKAAILAKNENKIDDAKRYDDTAFYPGSLMIVGDLVKASNARAAGGANDDSDSVANSVSDSVRLLRDADPFSRVGTAVDRANSGFDDRPDSSHLGTRRPPVPGKTSRLSVSRSSSADQNLSIAEDAPSGLHCHITGQADDR